IERLKSEKSNVDLYQLKQLYNEAKAYIDKIDRTYDELVSFHNSMIQNRIEFINNQLDIKNKELTAILENRDVLLEEKKKLTIDILDEGLLDELNVLNTKIENLNMEKGEINQAIKILEGVEHEKNELINQIKEIKEQMDSDNITKKIR